MLDRDHLDIRWLGTEWKAGFTTANGALLNARTLAGGATSGMIGDFTDPTSATEVQEWLTYHVPDFAAISDWFARHVEVRILRRRHPPGDLTGFTVRGRRAIRRTLVRPWTNGETSAGLWKRIQPPRGTFLAR